MPTAQRRPPAGLIARLLAEPQRFGFFQAVRLLRRWLGEDGAGALPTAGRLRFRNLPSLAFPASEVAALDVVGDAGAACGGPAPASLAPSAPLALAPPAPAPSAAGVERVELTPAAFGLLGPGGALPAHYAELLAEREYLHRDGAARAFLDLFQDRAAALFHEAWRKHRLPVQYEADRRQRFLPLVLALAGAGQPALRDRLRGDEGRGGGVADETLAWFAGLVQQRPVSAAALRQAVSDHFGVAVGIEQFVGRWFVLPPDSATSLGVGACVLGAGAVVGERVWQRDLRLRLTIGPLDRAAFDRFLPGGSAALALRELLTLFTGVALEYEVRLALRADAVQGARLAGSGSGGQPAAAAAAAARPRPLATPAAHASAGTASCSPGRRSGPAATRATTSTRWPEPRRRSGDPALA